MKKLVLTTLLVFMISSVGFASPLMDYSKGSVGFDYTYRPNLSLSGGAEAVGTINPPISCIIHYEGAFNESISHDFDGSANLDMGLTIGIGNNWAVQYRQYNPKGTIWSHTFTEPAAPVLTATDSVESISQIPDYNNSLYVGFEGKIRSDEYNVLYKISPNAAAFAGIVRTSAGIRPSLSGSYNGFSFDSTIPEIRSNDENIFHVGLLGSTKLADKLTGYGVVSFGSDYRNWQAGLSYELDKDWEFDLNYRSTKFGKYKVAGVSITPPAQFESSTSYADINLKDVEAKGWGFGLVYKF